MAFYVLIHRMKQFANSSVVGVIASAVLVSNCPAAQAKTLVVQPGASTGIAFEIGYDLGTHHGTATTVTGSAELDGSDNLLSAHFEVPLSDITTKKNERDCHLREAMGLDYSKSRYPKDHVCDDDYHLPSQGVDAIAFPKISFDFSAANFDRGQGIINSTAQIQIHGQTISKPIQLHVQKSTDDSGKTVYQVKADFPLALADFNVVVIPFLGMGVDKEALVHITSTLSEK